MRFRLARRGEGEAVARLGTTALKGHTQGSEAGDLATAVNEHGGLLRVPWGRAYAIVGVVDDEVQALAYATPPVRLAESYEERGKAWQKTLASRVAEIQLLAVEESFRGQGHAVHLLTVTEESLRRRGCGAVLVKVLKDDTPVLDWYRKRGYTVLGIDEYAVLWVGGQQVPITSRRDEPYLAAVKRIREES